MGTVGKIRASVLESQRLMLDALCVTLNVGGISIVGRHRDTTAFLKALEHEVPDVAVVDSPIPRLAPLLVERALWVRPQQRVVVLAAKELSAACEEAGARAVVDRVNTSVEDLLRIVQEVGHGAPPAKRAKSKRAALPGLGADLSQREIEVLAHIGEGMDNLKIASTLGISEHTVKIHVGRLYQKLHKENRAEMALLARDLGITLTK